MTMIMYCLVKHLFIYYSVAHKMMCRIYMIRSHCPSIQSITTAEPTDRPTFAPCHNLPVLTMGNPRQCLAITSSVSLKCLLQALISSLRLFDDRIGMFAE